MRRSVALLLAAAASLAIALPAGAADPSSGTVSAGEPKVEWTGTVMGDPLGLVLDVMTESGGTQGACDDGPPICDTYTLTVAEEGKKLAVTVTGAAEDDWMAVEVIDPEGNETFVYPAASGAVTAELSNPMAGDYTVHVLAYPPTGEVESAYTGVATLTADAPAPEPTPQPTPTPTPPPTATPTSEQPRPPAEAAAPPPPPRTLALHADRRRLWRAARLGFRVRVVCTGGCVKVKVRAFVSPLTARQMGLGRSRTDVRIGDAPVVRSAEGRRIVWLRFRPSLRDRIARKRRLTIAIEAMATDPDGRERTFFKRMTLRR